MNSQEEQKVHDTDNELSKAEEKLNKVFKLKKSHELIGLFHRNTNGVWSVSNLRNTKFTSLHNALKDGTKVIVKYDNIKGTKLLSDRYYKFSWRLSNIESNYQLTVNEEDKLVLYTPQMIVNCLYTDLYDDCTPSASQKIVKMLDTLKNQLTASGKEIFIYELLQNANDNPNSKNEKVEVEFYFTDNYLIFQHSGAYFNDNNIAAICNINDSVNEKTDNKQAIGYKGIGFKTVFLENNYVYLNTGEYSFCFDKHEKEDEYDIPWQILPLWKNPCEVDKEITDVFSTSDKKFRVQFALRPNRQQKLNESDGNYKQMFSKVFENERVILFIPNLSSVKVFYSDTLKADINCQKDNKNWIVSHFDSQVDESIQNEIKDEIDNKDQNGASKIPEKYKKFSQTRVSFACNKNGLKVVTVPDANLFCYLPTHAKWGFNFLMNTDMIPTGPRDDIEMNLFLNLYLSQIAGENFFKWIKDLLTNDYEKDVIFDLIPDFVKCITEHNKYQEYISAFQKGFESMLEVHEFIPTGQSLVNINSVLYDESGITSEGIMTDDNFYSFVGSDKLLPIKSVRKYKGFNKVLLYSFNRFDIKDSIFGFDELVDLVDDESFKTWLKIPRNNDNFLNFLIRKNKLNDFSNLCIFLNNENELNCAKDLYYNVENELRDLDFMSERLPSLATRTRTLFDNSEEDLSKTKKCFIKFNAKKFVDQNILDKKNKNDSICLLSQNINNSISFIHFLAINHVFEKTYKDLPFFDVSDRVKFFRTKVFYKSDRGLLVQKMLWVDESWFSFISDKYFLKDGDIVKEFLNGLGVQVYTDKEVVSAIILSEKVISTINSQIENQDLHMSFIDYIIEVNRSFVQDKKAILTKDSLRQYALYFNDHNGVESTQNDVVAYFSSELYDEYDKRGWLKNEWMYSLSGKYFKDKNELLVKEIKTVFSNLFGVKEFSVNEFYDNVVRKHNNEILQGITNLELSIDFIQFLMNNYKHIFDVKHDDAKYKNICIFSEEGSFDRTGYDSTFIFKGESDFETVIKSNWFPEGLYYLTNIQYFKCLKQEVNFDNFFNKLGFEKFSDMNNIINKLLSNNQLAVKKQIQTLEKNIEFHNFMSSNVSSITSVTLEKIKEMPVFLANDDDSSRIDVKSVNHYQFSDELQELLDMNLISLSFVSVIDKQYSCSSSYWEETLKNQPFSLIDFLTNSDVKTIDNWFYSISQNPENNIKLCRWIIKKYSSNDIYKCKKLSRFPIYVLDSNGTQTLRLKSSSIPTYIPDCYMPKSCGISVMVEKYNKSKKFYVSDIYNKADDSIQEEKYQKFFEYLGVITSIDDLIFKQIIPNLSDIEYEDLPFLLSRSRSEIDKKWEEIKYCFMNLQLKVKGGTYNNIKDCIIVSKGLLDNDKFKEIILENEVVESYAADEKTFALLLKIGSEITHTTIIKATKDLLQIKIDYYLANQNQFSKEIHMKFITDCCELSDDFKSRLKSDNKILFYSEDMELLKSDELTLGTVYKPVCDFEKNGIGRDSLNFLSEKYLKFTSIDKIKSLSRFHDYFEKKDVDFLKESNFALYFWKTYAEKPSLKNRIRSFIDEHVFKDIICVPTAMGVKKANELYSLDIIDFVENKISDWKEKLPDQELLNNVDLLIHKLDYKTTLSFSDSLNALLQIKDKEKREKIVSWLLTDYNKTKDANDCISRYRQNENAKWQNKIGKFVHIKYLYCIDVKDRSLNQSLVSNAHVIDTSYLSDDEASIIDVCNILQIPIIYSQDMKVLPEGSEDMTIQLRKIFAFNLLLVAANEDENKWEEKFDNYNNTLLTLHFIKCKSIAVVYNQCKDIHQSGKDFYFHKASNRFYFVDAWDDKQVYLYFIDTLREQCNCELDKDSFNKMFSGKGNPIGNLSLKYPILLSNISFINKVKEYDSSLATKLLQNKTKVLDEDDEIEEGFSDDSSLKERQKKTNSSAEKEKNIVDNMVPEIILDENPNEANIGQSRDDSAETKYSQPENLDSHQNSGESNRIHGQDENQVNENQKSSFVSKNYSNEKFSEGNNTNISSLSSEGDNIYKKVSNTKTNNRPRPNSSRGHSTGATAWKNDSPKINFTSSDPTIEEINAINNILDCTLTQEQIIDEHYLSRLRLFNVLSKHEAEVGNKKEFISQKHSKINSSKGFIYTRSAKSGILYIALWLWEKIDKHEARLCVYYGNTSNEYLLISNTEELGELILRDPVLVKIPVQSNPTQSIQNIISGEVQQKAYIMIRIKSDERYNSLFESTMKADENNDANF